MTFSLDSFLSLEGLVGHLSYVFLVASMLMRRMVWLRLFAVASFATGIFFSIWILPDPIGTFWEVLLVVVTVVELARIGLENRRARFSNEDLAFCARCFPALPAGQRRQLLDLGQWRSLPAGHVLAEEGRPVSHLTYVAKGEARVEVEGRPVARRGAGALLGEMTVATGSPAHGQVVLTEEALVWQAEAGPLRNVMAQRPVIGEALRAAFFQAVIDKLASSHAQPVERVAP